MTEIEKITGGPDKWDLISSFADRMAVVFKTETREITGLISSIEHEDGSRQSFNIEFQTGCNGVDKQVYYHTKTRKGHMKAFVKKS
jgi:hypothetical protein